MMEQYRLLEEQRTEAKEAMIRLFRFRARRGIGVSYALVSLLLLFAVSLFALPIPPYAAIGAILAAGAAVWYVARAAGFRGFDQMEYSLEFLEGGEELVRSRRKWYTSPWFSRLVTDAFAVAFIGSEALNLSSVSILLLTTWFAAAILLKIFALSRRKDAILERRPEDWAIVLVLVVLVGSVLVAQTWYWGVLLAVPIYLISGLKSLYDAPKELIRGAS